MGKRSGRDDLRRLTLIALRRPFLGRRPRRLLVLLAGLVAIVGWQWTFVVQRAHLDRSFPLEASSGLNAEHRFVYFFYYLGLYPVTSVEGHRDFLGERGYDRFSREAAERVIRERGESLLMEWKHTIRVGERGKMFLYLPDAILKGKPRPPLSVRPLHAAVFTLALGAVFSAFWWARLPLLGAVLTLLVGSHPFQVFEVYGNKNVFGWPITTSLLVLALSVPFLRSRRRPLFPLVAPAAAIGALVATIGQVRSEPATIIVSALLACVFLTGARASARLALAATVLGAFFAVSTAWRLWFDFKFAQARSVVAAAGGHPYDGPRDMTHAIWHPIWCGLGDFDTTHGYAWADTAAAGYAHPILRDVYGVPVPEWNPESWGYYDAFWDPGRRYYKMPYEMPHYSEVLRDKVLSDIAEDPGWYAGILGRRAWRLLTETAPLRVAVGAAYVTLPWSGLSDASHHRGPRRDAKLDALEGRELSARHLTSRTADLLRPRHDDVQLVPRRVRRRRAFGRGRGTHGLRPETVAAVVSRPLVSVIAPVYNEEPVIDEFVRRLRAVMEALADKYDFEVLLVDDGSRDGSLARMKALVVAEPRLRVLELRRNYGQTAALQAGFDAARGEILLSMDSDLQHFPEDIPQFLETLETGYEVVCGWRHQRAEGIVRRWPSRVANLLLRGVSGLEIHDFGTTFRAYRAELVKDLRLLGDFHRYIPALARQAGGRITEVPIRNIVRPAGESSYGLGRTVGVSLDLVLLYFLFRYMDRPMRAFGQLALVRGHRGRRHPRRPPRHGLDVRGPDRARAQRLVPDLHTAPARLDPDRPHGHPGRDTRARPLRNGGPPRLRRAARVARGGAAGLMCGLVGLYAADGPVPHRALWGRPRQPPAPPRPGRRVVLGRRSVLPRDIAAWPSSAWIRATSRWRPRTAASWSSSTARSTTSSS